MLTKAETAALTKRQAQVAYVADLFVVAFHRSREIGTFPDDPTHGPNARMTAVTAGSRIILSDDNGADLGDVWEIAHRTLVGQDFQQVAVSLFLDDLTHDAADMARLTRKESGQ